MKLPIQVRYHSFCKLHELSSMLRIHRKSCAEDLEPEYVDDLCKVPGPFRIMHLRELIIVYQGFEVDSRAFLVAIILDLSRDIEEREVEFWERLIFERDLQFSLLVDFQAFLQWFTRMHSLFFSLGPYQLRHLFCPFEFTRPTY